MSMIASASTDECLRVEGISIERGDRRLISDVDLSLKAGELLAVLGPNGAGKSTLIRAITGEYPLASGQVLLNGKPGEQWDTLHRARQLSVLPQSSSLSFAFSVREVVLMGRTPCDSSREYNEEVCNQALVLTDVLHLQNRSYTQLSGGERQRVHLARVLAQIWDQPKHGHRVLLLGEPTSALDPKHQHQTLTVARNFAKQGAGVLVIIHDLNLASQYADRIVMLKDGRKCVDGAPEQVLTADIMQQVFDIKTSVIKHPVHGYPMVIPI